MPRGIRVEFPGAIYHVLGRGDRREVISYHDVDRQDFLKTLAEACQKHGIGADTPAGRRKFERPMEARRTSESDVESWEPLRAVWWVGGEAFRKELLDRMEGRLSEHHAGALRRESAEARGERILGEELARLGWHEPELRQRRKSDPEKLRIAARVRREKTLTIGWIAERLWLGTRKSAGTRVQEYKAGRQAGTSGRELPIL